jgi:hypothetical protein
MGRRWKARLSDNAQRPKLCNMAGDLLVLGRGQTADAHSSDDHTFGVFEDAAAGQCRKPVIAKVGQRDVFAAQAFEQRVCIYLHACGTVGLRLRYGDTADWSAAHPLESDEESGHVANGRANRSPVICGRFFDGVPDKFIGTFQAEAGPGLLLPMLA